MCVWRACKFSQGSEGSSNMTPLCVCVCVCEPPPHQTDPQRGGGVDRVHAPLARSGEIATHLTPNGVAGQRRDA